MICCDVGLNSVTFRLGDMGQTKSADVHLFLNRTKKDASAVSSLDSGCCWSWRSHWIFIAVAFTMVWNWVVAHIDDFKKQINYWCIDLRRNSYWPVLMSYFICCVQSLPHCCLKVSFTVMSLFQVKWHFPHHSFVPHLSYAWKLNLDIKMIAVCCSSMGMTGREYEFIWVWLNGNGQTHLSWLALQTLNKYKLLGGNSSISRQILGLCETIYDSISGGFAHWDFTSVSRSSGLDMCV